MWWWWYGILQDIFMRMHAHGMYLDNNRYIKDIKGNSSLTFCTTTLGKIMEKFREDFVYSEILGKNPTFSRFFRTISPSVRTLRVNCATLWHV